MKPMAMKRICFIILALCLCMTACNSKTKTVDQLQNTVGALLEGGRFEEGSELNFDEVDNASKTADEIFEKLGEIGVMITDKSKAYIYDISVTKDGQEVQPNGKVKITVPMPQEDTETEYSVYHVKDSGKTEKIAATYANGKLSFETDGFSYYVFVATQYVNQDVSDITVETTVNINEGTAPEEETKKDASSSTVETTVNANEDTAPEEETKKDASSSTVETTVNANEDTAPEEETKKDVSPVPAETTVREEKPDGLKLDAHNAGFTYNEDGKLVTTVCRIGSENKPNAEKVLVYATYPTQADKSLTINEDYSVDLGGLDFTKTGTYTIKYTYKADSSLTATLTVQVIEKLSDGSMTEDEWNAVIGYWKNRTNVKVVERISSPHDGWDTGAQIMLYQFDGTAYSEDGYFENSQASQEYKGKALYYVKEGEKYYYIYWGYLNEECWVKSPASQSGYEGHIKSEIYRLPDYVSDGENENAFDYSNFTFDAETKTYKNSDGNITLAFTFNENNVLTKFVLTQYRASDSTTFERTTTFGDAVVDAPDVTVKSYFATCRGTEDNNKVGGHITENGEEVDYRRYLEAGTTVTLTAVADNGYVFKHWATCDYNYEKKELEWNILSGEKTYAVTIGEDAITLYAVFEEEES